MSDHYVSFSEVLVLENAEEAEWLRKRLRLLENPESTCAQRKKLLERYEMDDGDTLGFEWTVWDDRVLFFSRESWGDPYQLAMIVQDILGARDDPGHFSIRHSRISIPLRPSGDSSGALFVTRECIEEFSTESWLAGKQAAWGA